jgi:8-oxo-dGTP pyrophosphatase MutT (NUDIX family)
MRSLIRTTKNYALYSSRSAPFFASLFSHHFTHRMNTASLLASLEEHVSENAIEEKYRIDTILFVRRFPQHWWQRRSSDHDCAGHVTASAMVVNHDKKYALLLHHAKLNRWLQPGGHLDETDISPVAGAMREAREESGVATLSLVNEQLFDIDIHAIPARGTGTNAEAAHLHYDVRYLIIAESSVVSLSNESIGFQWKSIESLITDGNDESIARMARKVLRLS